MYGINVVLVVAVTYHTMRYAATSFLTTISSNV